MKDPVMCDVGSCLAHAVKWVWSAGAGERPMCSRHFQGALDHNKRTNTTYFVPIGDVWPPVEGVNYA